jgi:carotenoid cleavage dioxygenase
MCGGFLPGSIAMPRYVPGRLPLAELNTAVVSRAGARQRYDYGEGVHGNEAPFAPRRGAAAGHVGPDDDGYLVTFTTDQSDWRSHCLVFDATDISRGPLARVRIPHRVPLGFHACWVRGEDLG